MDTPTHMEELIHHADGLLQRKGLPDDVVKFLERMTSWREEIISDIDRHDMGGIRDEADQAATLCDKYGILYLVELEYREGDGWMREKYSDGTYGEWQ